MTIAAEARCLSDSSPSAKTLAHLADLPSATHTVINLVPLESVSMSETAMPKSVCAAVLAALAHSA